MRPGWAGVHGLSAGCPHCCVWLFAVSGLRVDDVQGEVLEFGEQGAEFAGVVEQGLVVGELGGGEASGEGNLGTRSDPLTPPAQRGENCPRPVRSCWRPSAAS